MDMEKFGNSENYLRTFDPEGKIVNEAINGNRGKWSSGASGVDAVFTLNVQNCSSDIQRAELFGAANSIVEIPNDSEYSVYGNFRPFTTEQIVCLIGIVATTAEADEGDIIPPAMVIYDDRTGNLVYLSGIDRTLADWAALFTSQLPLTPLTLGTVVIISCGQRSYRSLMSDLRDLVLYVKETKIKYPDEEGMDNTLTFNRPKSFGGADSNTLEPSNYFDPDQNQSKLIKIPERYFIDKLTTIYLDVNGSGVPGEPANPVNITFKVTAYQNNGVMMQ